MITIKDSEAEIKTDRNKMERRQEMKGLLLRIAELEREKLELNALKDAIIHNLSSPIYAITEYSSELKSKINDHDHPEIIEYVNRILKIARQSSNMLKELIALIRANSVELCKQSIDLSAIANNIVAGYSEIEPERQVEVIIQPGMKIDGDTLLMRLLMMELIGNAWKYTAKKAQAKIEVGCQQTSKEDIIYVRDNGIGFDPLWAGLIFEAFKRFCEDPDFEGAGIGLATVARIVERHGGRTWAVGYPGQGATVYVALAINRDDFPM